jgi:glycosyltransferase involved in cell wall biosynthesis
MKDLITVLIPCYNGEKYIDRCIKSVLNQTYSNLQIIAVNDGSTDNTGEILKQYAFSDKRLSVIDQENCGAGAALNRAINLCEGKFLTFVDNDDWLEPEMYERLYQALTENDADVSVCNFNLAYDDHVLRDFSNSNLSDVTVSIRSDIKGYFEQFCSCEKPNNYNWSRLYKTDIIKNSGIRFELFRLGADSLFNFKLLPLLNRVSFIKESFYNYYQHPDSVVNSIGKSMNIAVVYADGFDSLAQYFENRYKEFIQVLPVYANTRLRSVKFYGKLAGLSDEKIKDSIKSGFGGRKILEYLSESDLF